MKKALALILSFLLLTVLGCATTGQDASQTAEPAPAETVDAGPVDYDLSGTWEMTADDNGCGTRKTEITTVEIVQTGNSVTATNIDEGWTWTRTPSGHTIVMPSSKMGKVRLYEYELKVSDDANTITGELEWNYNNECGGATKVSYIRK